PDLASGNPAMIASAPAASEALTMKITPRPSLRANHCWIFPSRYSLTVSRTSAGSVFITCARSASGLIVRFTRTPVVGVGVGAGACASVATAHTTTIEGAISARAFRRTMRLLLLIIVYTTIEHHVSNSCPGHHSRQGFADARRRAARRQRPDLV